MPNPQGHVANLKKYQPKWQSGATQTIRVPIALTDQIFAYARLLDQGEMPNSNLGGQTPENSNKSLLQVIQKLESVLDTPRNNFSREKKGLLKTAIDELQSLVTSGTMQQ